MVLTTLMLWASLPQAAPPIDEVVVTANRIEQPLIEIPASVSTVAAEELALVSHQHIQQSLNRLAGVNLQHGNGQEYLPAIRSPVLTGAGACGGFLVSEDNIPLRAAGFCNINELFEAHTEQATRLEVLRGPGTALYGSNAVHGVINVVTDPAQQAGQLGLELGSYDYRRLKLAVGGPDLAAALTVTDDDAWRADSSVDQQKLSVRHRAQRGALAVTSGLAASHLEQETAGFITGQNAYQDRDIARSNPNPEAFRNVDAARLWSRLEHAASDRSWRVTPYARYTEMEFLQHFLPGNPLEENGQRSLGLQSQFERVASPAFSWTVGLDAEYTDAYLRQRQDQPTQGSPFLVGTVPEGQHYDYQVDARMLAPFAQLRWALTERTTLVLGARHERVRYDYDNQMLDGRTRDDGSECGFGGCRYSRPADRNDRFDNTSVKLGLTHELGEQQVYLNLASGFRAPQATELYRLQRDQQVADLRSEEATNVEIGWRGRLGRVDYQAALYQLDKDKVIFRDRDFFNVSDGRTRHRGLELELSALLGGGFDMTAAATLARHTYERSPDLVAEDIRGNDVDTAPRHFGSIRLGWQPDDKLRSELEWVHMGAYYLEPENQHSYSGHDLLHWRGSWQLDQGWRLSLRVNNLTDQRYAERADFTSFTNERYFPGLPRNYQLGLQYRW